jgi:hypothetical protein
MHPCGLIMIGGIALIIFIAIIELINGENEYHCYYKPKDSKGKK